MLLNATELELYLQSAFDHFTKSLDMAFDFVQASFIHSPIPPGFGGNILRMAISLTEDHTIMFRRTNPRMTFDKLAKMVASCILIDSVRHDIIGETVENALGVSLTLRRYC
jgi:hypothetical protein